MCFILQISAGSQEYMLEAVDSGSILLVIGGSAEGTSQSFGDKTLRINTGSVIFIGAQQALKLFIKSDEGMLMFRAYCPLDGTKL